MPLTRDDRALVFGIIVALLLVIMWLDARATQRDIVQKLDAIETAVHDEAGVTQAWSSSVRIILTRIEEKQKNAESRRNQSDPERRDAE